MVYLAKGEGGSSLHEMSGVSPWKQVTLPGRLPLVNEGTKRWKAREVTKTTMHEGTKYSSLAKSRKSTKELSAQDSQATMISPPTTPSFTPRCLQRLSSDMPPLVFPKSPSGRSSTRASSLSVSARDWSPTAERLQMDLNLDKLRYKVLRTSFTMADKDKDNKLSKAEFSLMLRRANPEMPSQAVDKAFALADLSCQRHIDFNSFVQWAGKENFDEAEDDNEPLFALFRLWDLDEDGAISPQEAEYAFRKACPNMKNEEIKEIFTFMDEDCDDEVGYLEFVNFLFPPRQALPSPLVSSRLMGS